MITAHTSMVTKTTIVKLLLGIGFIVQSIFGASLYAQSILDLIFPGFLPNLIVKTFPTQFKGGSNNYAGSLIIDSVTPTTPITITIGSTSLVCTKQINGYYSNSARGFRLWPLSDNNLSILKQVNGTYSDLTMVGGLYTACNNGNPQDVVGYISYRQGSIDQGTILFGVTTDNSTNSYTTTFDQHGFLLKNFTLPDGRFYDTVVGIGSVSSSDYVDFITDNPYNNPFASSSSSSEGGDEGLANSFWNISVQGRLGLSFAVDALERQTLRGNIGRKSIIYSSDEITSSKAINGAAKNAEIFCRGGNTFQYEQGSTISSIIGEQNNSSVICINGGENSSERPTISLGHDEVNRLQGKDLIVRNTDIFIDKEVFVDSEQKLSLFIDRGNLILDNSIDETFLQSFDKNGYRVINGGVTKGLYLQGNFVINGLLLGAPAFNDTNYSPIPAKTFIHGKFASLNLPTASYDNRKKQIETMFEGNLAGGIDLISLNDLFPRRCADIGTGAGHGLENSSTPFKESLIPCNGTGDSHAYSSFIVVEKDIPSILFKQ